MKDQWLKSYRLNALRMMAVGIITAAGYYRALLKSYLVDPRS